MVNDTPITKDIVQACISSALQKYIGPRGTISYAEACTALEVDSRTIESWVRGETPPHTHNLLKLFRLLGPGFANAVLKLANIGHAERLEPEALSDLFLNAKLAESLAALADALHDGRIDHLERADLIPMLQLLSTKIDQWCRRNP